MVDALEEMFYLEHFNIYGYVFYAVWIRRGLVVTRPGSQAFDSPLYPRTPGRYIPVNVRCCEGLFMVLQVKDLLELFVKRREFRPGVGCLSPHDMR